MSQLQAKREQAIHLLRAGMKTEEVAVELGHSPQWVRKCWRKYQAEGWAGLSERSRAPHRHGRRMPDRVRRAVKKARSELEAEAARGIGLKYIGARAIRTRLKVWQLKPLPSIRTIERILQQEQLTHPRQPQPEIVYPHLQVKKPLELCQVDHIPRYLRGGQKVYCFNAIDIVSRYPTGQIKDDRRARTAADFLIHVWQTIGIPTYTQVDNEACFIGGFTHPYVLGQCVRLALMVGTELVFSPVRHPESNAYVERFHQDYQKHVWEDTYLANPMAAQRQADQFFTLYRHSRHHSALHEQTPTEIHLGVEQHLLASDFKLPAEKLPLYAGQVHFMRRVDPDGTVSVLNVHWTIPKTESIQAVWATLAIRPESAHLFIYERAPGVEGRKMLVAHPFPISEPVLDPGVTYMEGTPPAQDMDTENRSHLSASRLSRTFLTYVQQLKQFFNETMYWRL
jgi:transposase InsO family protein